MPKVHSHGLQLDRPWGSLRVSVLEAGLLRVHYSPTGTFVARRSWNVARPDSEFPPLALRHQETPEGIRLSWQGGELVIDPDGAVQPRFGGQTVAVDLGAPTQRRAKLSEFGDLKARPDDRLPEGAGSSLVRLVKRMHPAEGYYGFGQRTGELNRRHRRLVNWTVDPTWGHGRSHNNLYQALPAFLALRPGLAWGLFLNCTWYSQFDVGQNDADQLVIEALGGELDYYLLAGPTPAQVVDRLTHLTGRPALPPMWALGYHQSRWGYREQTEILDLVKQFRERDLPLDVVHLDIDYMRGYRSFTIDPVRFPDPAGLCRQLGEQGVRVVTIIDPGLKHDLSGGYASALEAATRGHLLTEPSGAPFIGFCWPDEAMFCDFTRAPVRHWWGEQHRGLLEAGVSGIWNDMNEPAIFDRPFSAGLAGHRPMPLALACGAPDEATCHAEVHNLYGHQMAQASYAGQARLRPHQRPWVLTRSGFVGTSRWAAAWMGDNNSWWEHLELSLPQLASMGLCGAPQVGVDIGGFFEHTHGELFGRWIEMAPFYPFMRNHSAFGTRAQEPWQFGSEIEATARQALKLRYRLLAYLYTLCHRAHQSGEPILRPMLFDFPDDPQAICLEDQVMFGPSLLVAPILKRGRRHRMVYVPEGTWYDFYTQEPRVGPSHHVLELPPGRAGLLVRGGAALPLLPERSSTAEPITGLEWRIYPGSGEFTLYEDDGLSPEAPVSTTRVVVEHSPECLKVELGERRGGYQPPPRSRQFSLLLPGPPSRVEGPQGRWEAPFYRIEQPRDEGNRLSLRLEYGTL